MPDFLTRVDAPDLAYLATEGEKQPFVMFLGGFRSDMMGTKAQFLEEQCKKMELPYIRFDYRGHGQSDGVFEEACISDWTQDALDILDHCTKGEVILIGSSMGGWVSLLLALKRPERIKAIIGLAAAPDFTNWIEEAMNDEQRHDIETKGYFDLPNDYDDTPYIITKKLIEDGHINCLLDKENDIQCPVRLIQGMKDTDVEWQTAHRIKNALMSENVEVLLIEEADHRLSEPNQLEILKKTLNDLI